MVVVADLSDMNQVENVKQVVEEDDVRVVEDDVNHVAEVDVREVATYSEAY